MIDFVYRQILRREATPVEVSDWAAEMEVGLTFDDFLALVKNSDEALAVTEAEALRLADDPDFAIGDAIKFIYRHAVGRMPSEDDIRIWANHLDVGLPFQRFVLGLVASDEGKRHAETGDDAPHPDAITFVYRRALGRGPSDADLAVWSNHIKAGLPFQRFLLSIVGSEEARMRAAGEIRDEEMPDALFVAHLYEICLGRCALPNEILSWKGQSFDSGYRRSDLAMMLISAAITEREQRGAAVQAYQSEHVLIMGTDRVLTAAGWKTRAAEIAAGQNVVPSEPLSVPYVIRPHTIRVSAIASLYRGRRYIRKFLDNMARQSLGENFELIIIDANSPEGEYEVIKEYSKRFPNIRYERINYRIGIYEAWNVGVDLARGDYLTNTNLDDLRRTDSLEIQAGMLDSVPFADIIYQDFFYSLDPELSFEEVEAFGFKSALPVVTANNLLMYNSPHNAPMWRKRLHAELGLFDTSLKSAGDHEFWLRCLEANKIFYKVNTPHVVYYQNPEGISTRPDSLGVIEGRRLQCKYGRRLLAPEIYLDRTALSARLSDVSGEEATIKADEGAYNAIQRFALSLLDERVIPDASEATR